MSHAPERKEKDCLNCGTVTHGRFCHVCGQENIVPKESFGKLVIHFLYDITHFDSKFFSTVKDLFFKPGFLSKEYNRGRRASYLNPIRMYVFTSAIFFLIFFWTRGTINPELTGTEPFNRQERDSAILSIKEKMKEDSSDTRLKMQLILLSDTSKQIGYLDLLPYTEGFTSVSTFGRRYRNIREYDSIQGVLPPDKKDGWLKRLWNRKATRLNEKYKYDPSGSMKKISNLLLHDLPYLLFLSLPFFALILKLLYIRHRNFYYADHGIFSVHHYILSFILLLVVFLLDELNKIIDLGFLNILTVIIFLAWPVYLYLAMKRFYGQGGVKTFFKFFLLNILGLVVLAVLFAFFFLFSIFQL